MIVEKKRMGDHVLLRVEGVIKLGESAAFFADALRKVFENDEGDVLVDLSKIRLIDSTGLGELVAYLGRFRSAERRLLLINPADTIRDLLRMARLDDQFPTFDSVEAALAAGT